MKKGKMSKITQHLFINLEKKAANISRMVDPSLISIRFSQGTSQSDHHISKNRYKWSTCTNFWEILYIASILIHPKKPENLMTPVLDDVFFLNGKLDSPFPHLGRRGHQARSQARGRVPGTLLPKKTQWMAGSGFFKDPSWFFGYG